jgi:serine/threonine protein phosphatase 1
MPMRWPLVPPAHLAYPGQRCPTLHLSGDCVFVHAGLRPGVRAGPDQTETDLIWIREPFS